MRQPLKLSGFSGGPTKASPKLGEHTRDVCRDLLGLGDEEIEELVEAGTLEVPKTG